MTKKQAWRQIMKLIRCVTTFYGRSGFWDEAVNDRFYLLDFYRRS